MDLCIWLHCCSVNSLSHRERVGERGSNILAFSTRVPNFVLPPPSLESSRRERELTGQQWSGWAVFRAPWIAIALIPFHPGSVAVYGAGVRVFRAGIRPTPASCGSGLSLIKADCLCQWWGPLLVRSSRLWTIANAIIMSNSCRDCLIAS